MAIYTTTVTSGTTIFDFDTSGTNLLVTETGSLIGTGGNPVVIGTGAGSYITVNGKIASDSGYAVNLSGANASVTVGASGGLYSNGVAMTLSGDGFLVNNFGQIFGKWGITAYGGSGTINNAGSIVGTSTGDYYYYEAGVYLVDNDDDSVNSAYTVNNSGTITGNDYAIYAGEYSYVTYYASDTSVFNTGLLIGGDAGAVFLGLGADSVVNSGTIIGDVFLGGDADVFDGRGGSVNGVVDGGAGDDIYIIDDAAISLVEAAAEGTDLVKAKTNFVLADNFENLTLIGGGNTSGTGNTADNTLNGNLADNVLRGKAGADTLAGGDGDDRLLGGIGGDTLKGDADDDVLRGGRGDDTLKGGGDNDTLIGGAGRDSLTGGAGEDVFRFVKAHHSLNSTQADRILDFTSGEDLIDLHTFAGEFSFIGSGGFSGAAEVRITEVGADSYVRVDIDGDSAGDMKIKVVGVIGLDAGDFLL